MKLLALSHITPPAYALHQLDTVNLEGGVFHLSSSTHGREHGREAEDTSRSLTLRLPRQA